ncbi:uncharacterized protein [Physcomitrium patens]|uniref:Phosphatidic acid phosphatase type 2/haloperoxidase domain-containing protein n=1 Tax=Physcomitrium patens TaxID=3218 RepID=A0A2K1LA56_PHYPA|nr:uncharacterized protein LOC112280048 [Physcomitrium patens]PNR62908.1 hypothetical protein PHYPA_001333 [Physcomitrium patens]|eukprot:XP_024370756.1 uncharacterized protein LOC112280048 [Physcomitrella patens]
MIMTTLTIRTKELLCVAITIIVMLQAPASTTAVVNNVAFEWTHMLDTLICPQGATNLGFAPLTSAIQPQLHLAQWHALIALKATGDCTTEQAVVAFASFKILSHYFSWTQILDFNLGPLLDRQLRSMDLTEKQKRLSKRIGQTVAVNLIRQRSPASEFTQGPVHAAVDDVINPQIGVFRHFATTPEGRDAAHFFFNQMVSWKPFVLPHPLQFIKDYLSEFKPPVIPSAEWDADWDGLKDIGRAGWSGRTAAMNLSANLYACPRLSNFKCSFEQAASAAIQTALPSNTSLYDSVLLLAKTSVSIHDAAITQVTVKFGFWFWRPEQAFRSGDGTHAPIPDWSPYHPTPLEPEYPSGTVTIVSAGTGPLQKYFGKDKDVPFFIEGGGTFNCEGFVGVPVPTVNFTSLDAFVTEAGKSRMYSGAHYQSSVDDAKEIGKRVADYVEKHWTHTQPSGVLPDPTFLDIFAKVVKKSGDFSPVRYDVSALK